MKAVVDSRNHGNAIGRNGQLGGGFRVRRSAALQRKQADGHLQVVHQPMIGFLAQEFLPLDQLLLLTKPSLAFRQRIAQSYFHGPVLDELALAALESAARPASANGRQGA
jgi:hypothetical protein